MSAGASAAPRAPLWPVVVVLAVLVLLPIGRTAELPVLIGALAACGMLLRRYGSMDWSALRLPLLLFACYWLPALLSSVDAVDAAKAWSTSLLALRFGLFALFASWALRDARLWPALELAIAAVLALWLIDAWVQALVGSGIAGAAEQHRLAGIFGAGNLKLGPVLATLSPFLLLAVRRRFGRIGLAAGFLFLLVPVLLAGSRAAWLMFALVCALLAWRETRRLLPWALLLGGLLASGAAAMFLLKDAEGFDARLQRSLRALDATPAALEHASAGRLSIWATAGRMAMAHPINGVGVRSFRHAYVDFAAADDTFVDVESGTGALHPHQIVLEVASETGLFGLLLWLTGSVAAWRAWRRADDHARQRALAPMLALVAMCFPLNTHLAFYASWWGLLFWWLLALYCAALSAGAPADATRTQSLR